MSPYGRQAGGSRRRGERRTHKLKVVLSEEEYEALTAAARYTDEFTSTWARDVLLSRAAGLWRQRNLVDGVAA